MAKSSIRLKTNLFLLIVTPLGFAFKFYSGAGNVWFNDYGAGVLYEVFWVLLIFMFYPTKTAANVIPIIVFFSTCMLEFLQLWHPQFLMAVRATFLGRALLGTTFVWWDFPHYLIGCLIGWGWLHRLLYRE